MILHIKLDGHDLVTHIRDQIFFARNDTGCPKEMDQMITG